MVFSIYGLPRDFFFSPSDLFVIVMVWLYGLVLVCWFNLCVGYVFVCPVLVKLFTCMNFLF